MSEDHTILLVGLAGLAFLVGIAMLYTGRPKSVLWYRRRLEERPLAPGAVGTDGHRGLLFAAPSEVAYPITIATTDLPAALRRAGAGCRLSYVVGIVVLLPTAMTAYEELLLRGPQVATLLGIPGIALAFGHLVARQELFAERRRSPGLIRKIALWTLVHNALVCGAVAVVCGLGIEGSWAALSTRVLGWGVLAYAVFSLWLGTALLRAAAVSDAAAVAVRPSVSPAGDSRAPLVAASAPP